MMCLRFSRSFSILPGPSKYFQRFEVQVQYQDHYQDLQVPGQYQVISTVPGPKQVMTVRRVDPMWRVGHLVVVPDQGRSRIYRLRGHELVQSWNRPVFVGVTLHFLGCLRSRPAQVLVVLLFASFEQVGCHRQCHPLLEGWMDPESKKGSACNGA